ncbi:hypothetical protein A2630_04445 [Candidatus Woesebacteria bacterium RIFCSPHIGHO2_01_FULL_44_10]|uniref:Uncharacterized protein n=1 Tax=Candidatus Woesebacteria bacterium RIFCSPLOWO2_01_FULL_44_14 TaxID=1802525 RepID=A0A1F8C391_9BACT|nr:MAG: hypothetical protein A2630_04445 [Candidatus Woesebacteria bacterium RIFCSPHIGHO2_01_FULL_44_10]OGM56029.1 MAG: hypothetical protein A3F62_03870 [Candidatus Woesebacteria bacterium RIFCSPHIGHO2_12_FULL_44_11]OGM70752.1 MAG: hypothetical protein A2975_02580 [Candidatus Woesebacteria bacterium RIFCSPLOWO2_01_FULL_44_14]
MNGKTHVEVDQSGKIGDTKVPTVLAFSNLENFSILVSATEKRKCILILRRKGKLSKRFYLKLFAACLFLLLERDIKSFNRVIVDIEYTGHNDKVKGYLLNLFSKKKVELESDIIQFGLIHRGKRKPKAHDKAYFTFKGDVKPDKVIKAEQLLKLLE